MKVKEGFVLRSVAGNYMVVGEGLKQIGFNKIISLNSTAAYLWESICARDFSVSDLQGLLVAKYGIDEQLAEKDATAIMEIWLKTGLLE